MTITPTPKAPSITEIERLGFGWQEVSQFDLDQLDEKRRVQARDSEHYAPKAEVDRYAVQMQHSQFPPIIVTGDGWIVDGNTRVGACRVAKVKFFPAIVLDVEYDTGTQRQKDQLLALAATLNNLNGRALTAKEARADVEAMLRLDWRAEQIARALGVKPGVVTQVKKEIDAAAKLRKVGLTDEGGKEAVRATALRALGSKDVLGLNDVPFKELAELTRDAGMNASEVRQTAKEMRETGSDDGAINRLRELRTEMGDRIREFELTGSSFPPVSRRLRQSLGHVIKYEGREQELIETDPNVSEMHADYLKRSINVLAKTLEMQAS